MGRSIKKRLNDNCLLEIFPNIKKNMKVNRCKVEQQHAFGSIESVLFFQVDLHFTERNSILLFETDSF